jgi:hypothetical protein
MDLSTCLQIPTKCPAPSLAWAGELCRSTAIPRDPGSLVSSVGVTASI